jgi:hypothetical protein
MVSSFSTSHGYVFLMFAALLVAAEGTTAAGKDYLKKNIAEPGVVSLPSGLQYKVVKSGPMGGKTPDKNSPCLCHYRGYLIDGTTFDSSYDRNEPITFAPNQVIKGWTEAMQVYIFTIKLFYFARLFAFCLTFSILLSFLLSS